MTERPSTIDGDLAGARLLRRIAELERQRAADEQTSAARIAALEARLDAAETRALGSEPADGASEGAPAPRSSRRGLIGAAGQPSLGGAGSLATPHAAAAGNGQALVIGGNNHGTNPTKLKYNLSSLDRNDCHFLISSGNAADVRSGLIAEANRDGVIGFANFDGWGVYGYSPDAVGVGGFSENGVDFYASGTGRIAFEPHLPLGPPTDATGEYLAGEIVRDEQGNICSTSCPTPSARCPRSAALRFPHAVNARSPCSPPYPQAPPPSPGR